MYVALRLLFVYADSGYSPEGKFGGQLVCDTGRPVRTCASWERGDGPDLAANGITDAASFEGAVWRLQLVGGAWIIGMNVGGALIAAGVRSVRRPPDHDVTDASMVEAPTTA